MKKMDWHKWYEETYDLILLYGIRILLATIVFSIGWWLINVFLSRLKLLMEKRKVDLSLKPFLLSLFSIVTRLILFIIVFHILGGQLTVFTSIIAAFGVAAGLALSGTLQNFTSGILILLLKPYRVGDSIFAQGQEGLVESIQIFYTVITTYDNKTVIIPNSKLSNEVIINISREGIRRLDVEFKFNYGIDYKQVENIFQTSVESLKYILKSPASRIGVSAIEADGYKVLVNVWLNAHGFQDDKLKFQEKLVDDLKINGIKLPGMT